MFINRKQKKMKNLPIYLVIPFFCCTFAADLVLVKRNETERRDICTNVGVKSRMGNAHRQRAGRISSSCRTRSLF